MHIALDRVEMLNRMGKKYLGTTMRDTGYSATGLSGTCVYYEIGKRMNGVWLTIDLGNDKTAKQYRQFH